MKMSKSELKKRMHRKTSDSTAETIKLAMHFPAWNEIAKIVSGPTSRHSAINLDEISKNIKDGDKVVIPGKVLGAGELNKKISISALSFSETAKEKLKHAKIEITELKEEIKNNKEAKGVKILK
jgi:large subunit ribosomal protein L18e